MTLEHNIPMTTEQMTNIEYHIKTTGYQQYLFEINNICSKSTISVRNQQYLFEINNICSKSTISVWNQQYLFEINNICSKSTISVSKYLWFPVTLNLFLSVQNHYKTSFGAESLQDIFRCRIIKRHLSVQNHYKTSFGAESLKDIFRCRIITRHLSLQNH